MYASADETRARHGRRLSFKFKAQDLHRKSGFHISLDGWQTGLLVQVARVLVLIFRDTITLTTRKTRLTRYAGPHIVAL